MQHIYKLYLTISKTNYNRTTVRLSTSTVAKIKIRIFTKFSGSNFISGHNDSKSTKKNFDPTRPGPARPGPTKRSLTLNNSETTGPIAPKFFMRVFDDKNS